MNREIVSIYIKENFPDGLRGASKKIKINSIRIYDALYKYTDYLPKSSSFKERVYNVMNCYNGRALCECGKVLPFIGTKDGYKKKCSKNCKG